VPRHHQQAGLEPVEDVAHDLLDERRLVVAQFPELPFPAPLGEGAAVLADVQQSASRSGISTVFMMR
jgi:hypothetical protein